MLRTGPHHLAPMDKEKGRSRLARSSPVPDLLEPSEGIGRISCDGNGSRNVCSYGHGEGLGPVGGSPRA
eukprot:8200896-Alexandrium_andersonii.AAC.1